MTNWEQYRATMQRPGTLWDAARANDTAEIDRLLRQGAAIDAPDPRGFTPLMLAAYAGHAEACDVLIGAGANVNSVDGAGNTVLMGAAFKGHHIIVDRLLDAGADAHRANAAGLDAAGFAEAFGRTAIVALLRQRVGRPHA